MLRRLSLRGLLALMLVLTGAYAAPLVRVDAPTEWRHRRPVVERHARQMRSTATATPAAPSYEYCFSPRFLEHSLFQRPPPFVVSAR